MEQGKIFRVVDYFLNPRQVWMFGPDVHRAMTEFLGHPGPLPEAIAPYFTEWFLFDFVFRDSMTPLGYFCRKNPLNLAGVELQFYAELESDNAYDFFEVVSLDKDAGEMKIMSVRTGRQFSVREGKATQECIKGEVLVCRVGLVGNYYEIVSGDTLSMEVPSRGDKRRMKQFPKIDPLIAYHAIIAPQESVMGWNAHDLGGGTALVTGIPDSMPTEGLDDCAVCQLMRKAKQDGQKPSREEIERAIEEVNRSQRSSS